MGVSVARISSGRRGLRFAHHSTVQQLAIARRAQRLLGQAALTGCAKLFRMTAGKHDDWTVAATACFAFVMADMSHEVIGHGVVAYFEGARHLLLSSTYLSSDINRKLVQAGGTIVNLLEAALAWLLLRRGTGSAHWQYFLWLLLVFNSLDSTGYFLFSAVLNSGDWAVIIQGLPNLSALRVVMGLTGAAAYVFAAYVCAGAGAFFRKTGRVDDDAVLDRPGSQLRCGRFESAWPSLCADLGASGHGRSQRGAYLLSPVGTTNPQGERTGSGGLTKYRLNWSGSGGRRSVCIGDWAGN